MKFLNKAITKLRYSRAGLSIKKINTKYADPNNLEKAFTYIERFREIVSDPLNILINRVPEAGYIDKNGYVILHNGNRVPICGDLSYYREFSDILIINRGVHEPLEEYCFQQMLTKIKNNHPNMIELGSYWAHYSMWLKKFFPKANCYMVEPDSNNLKCGKNNFSINGYNGHFINDFVGLSGFQLDTFTLKHDISSLDILHCDIQGYELEMLMGGHIFLSKNKVNYVFVSTHSDAIHYEVVKQLQNLSYRVEISSNVDTHSTSCDGFVLATSLNIDPLFDGFTPLGRIDILKSSPKQILQSIVSNT
ncbi:MAG: FkbM family methyltransferase [Deltaproteobacteria bacterium]